ncbi:hypothetical protein GCM10010191_67980 [Actinomadura vinacea]|uniref:Uncharacterized protein n=1 Tax=Actinomadura vinacea TaxID=115336 RepID=A0ABN3JXI0_9ACTN
MMVPGPVGRGRGRPSTALPGLWAGAALRTAPKAARAKRGRPSTVRGLLWAGPATRPAPRSGALEPVKKL